MVRIPDSISTLELSKLCIYKALQELESSRNQQKTDNNSQEDPRR